tara:strand:- start:4232 stop:4471 length:240 start_codon:yes stop_codon:yes gene_type:complete
MGKDEQRKTFNLRISWKDDDGQYISRRFFTKAHACRELHISVMSISRMLRGVAVPKFRHLTVEAIREPAQIISFQQLYE